MRHIDFDPAKLTGEQKKFWEKWQAKSQKITKEIIDAWEKGEDYDFDNTEAKVWGELKSWLLENIFNGKCAFCENKLIGAPLHAEHYRPKGEVTTVVDPATKKSIKVTVNDESGKSINHPGYFWLALNWKNLLPSCYTCNSTYKRTLFPVKRNYVYFMNAKDIDKTKLKGEYITTHKNGIEYIFLNPEDLNNIEEPLILHPYFDDPQEHLAFDELGNIVPLHKSEKGAATIRVFGLDNEDLIEERREEVKKAKGYLLEVIENKPDARMKINGYKKGTAQYSCTVNAFFASLEKMGIKIDTI
jgi:hypothetical protein